MQKITDLKNQNLSTKSSFSALLSLGSNIEPKENYLNQAIYSISNDGYCKIIKTSFVLKNPPILYIEQDDFLNQLIEIETILSPFELLNYLKKVEIKIGRKQRFRYGPREIDVDILFYEDLVINTENLKIPHPGVYDRDYLKILLKEFELTKFNFNF